MKRNINNVLNDVLYVGDEKTIDFKINKIINRLINKYNFSDDYLMKALKERNSEYFLTINGDYDFDYLQGEPNVNEWKYCATSLFNQNSDSTQITNAIIGILSCLSFENKFISVNTNDQSNKKELLSELIPNILVNHLLISYKKFLCNKKHSKETFFIFIKNHFNPPKILFLSNNNQLANDICRIKNDIIFTWVFLKARIFIPCFNDLFYSLNLCVNDLEKNINYLDAIKNKYYLQKTQLLLNEIPNNFLLASKMIFGRKKNEWDKIPNALYEDIISRLIFFEDDFFDDFSYETYSGVDMEWVSHNYRHICEWLYLDNWLKEETLQFDIKNLGYLKPVISADINDFVDLMEAGIWCDENKNLEQFDYVIIDDAHKISTKYLPFFSFAFKNIIAIGEYEKDNVNKNNDAIKNIYQLISNKENNIELSELFNNLKLNTTTQEQSILEWINENSKTETSVDKNVIKKGICL